MSELVKRKQLSTTRKWAACTYVVNETSFSWKCDNTRLSAMNEHKAVMAAVSSPLLRNLASAVAVQQSSRAACGEQKECDVTRGARKQGWDTQRVLLSQEQHGNHDLCKTCAHFSCCIRDAGLASSLQRSITSIRLSGSLSSTTLRS